MDFKNEIAELRGIQEDIKKLEQDAIDMEVEAEELFDETIAKKEAEIYSKPYEEWPDNEEELNKWLAELDGQKKR